VILCQNISSRFTSVQHPPMQQHEPVCLVLKTNWVNKSRCDWKVYRGMCRLMYSSNFFVFLEFGFIPFTLFWFNLALTCILTIYLGYRLDNFFDMKVSWLIIGASFFQFQWLNVISRLYILACSFYTIEREWFQNIVACFQSFVLVIKTKTTIII
jgi:hypothetical protein